MSGTFYIIPTPIGNLQDTTLRALEILGKLDTLFCEDKRITVRLLNRYSLKIPLVSLHGHNAQQRIGLIERRLREGCDVGYAVDAGTPGVSDPGPEVVSLLRERGYLISALPGASALTLAYSLSGFRSKNFHFLGFPKRNYSDLGPLLTLGFPVIVYEAPKRMRKLISYLAERLEPERQVFIARELTKIYEETMTMTISQWAEKIGEITEKGEFVVIIDALKSSRALRREGLRNKRWD